jgi:ribosomal protein L34
MFLGTGQQVFRSRRVKTAVEVDACAQVLGVRIERRLGFRYRMKEKI